jgi:hypothetical protein
MRSIEVRRPYKKIVSELFANYFETVVGLTTEELKTKSIYSTTNKQRIRGFSSRNSLRSDMQTAKQCRYGCCGSFYRPKEELLADGAIHIINSPFNNSL